MPEDELGARATALALLKCGEIDIEGRMPYSSNATFLVNLRDGALVGQGIYKPLKGERPLWDFEAGLYRREVAAYQLSETMGFGVVPPTIVRSGPYGEGSIQWFVNADHSQHYFTIFENNPETHDALRRMAVLDVIANNTDRKSGHVLLGHDRNIWGIDHGLCFAADFKLRTVIWEFAGEALPETAIVPLTRLVDGVPLEISALLNDEEVEAISDRASWLLELGAFPVDETGRRYPWPLV